MQIDLRDYDLYDFDLKKTSRARYMAKNPQTSQEYQKYEKTNMEHKGNTLVKCKRDIR